MTTIVFALYPQLTQLDFTGPFEVLTKLPGARCTVASVAGGELHSDSGLAFAGLQRLTDVPACDVLCVPGGDGVTAAMDDAAFLAELRRLAAGAHWVTSVCTGSLLLAAAGLLHGKRSACHWAWRDLLRPFGALPDEARVVEDGRFMSGGGVTAGIDMALTLVARIAGPTVARAVQLGMEYAPAPPFDSGRPERADPAVLAMVLRRGAPARVRRQAAVERALAALAAAA